MDTWNFRRLVVWQRARDLAVDVFKATSDKSFARDWSLRDQMRRAAVSVASNIAEGNQRGSDRECVRFLYFARSSIAELLTQIEVAAAVDLLPQDVASRWSCRCEEMGRMLVGLIKRRTNRSEV